MRGVIIGGVEYPVISPGGTYVPVLTWKEHKIRFRAGEGFNKRRTQEVTAAIWHWTGGEGEPDQMAETLKARKLGIEFAIDSLGTIWQFCDPTLVNTADAGSWNSFSVGIEIVCCGHYQPVPEKALKREEYKATIHGVEISVRDFHPGQYSAALGLARVLCRAMDIPPIVERNVNQIIELHHGTMCGHFGHCSIDSKKLDPGPRLMRKLHEFFKSDSGNGAERMTNIAGFVIKKEVCFEAAHQLHGLPPEHQCSRLHGHSYKVVVELAAKELDETGFVLDFGLISGAIKGRYDHQNLNETMRLNTTAENLAVEIGKLILEVLFRLQEENRVVLRSVLVNETGSSEVVALFEED